MRARIQLTRAPHERLARHHAALATVAGLALIAAPAASATDSLY
jgi:hypothetical protein